MSTSAQLVGALRRSFNVVAHPHMKDRDELRWLAEEQAALRRVATLVARGAPPDRAEAIGGTLSLHTPPGVGTSLHVELPLDDRHH